MSPDSIRRRGVSSAGYSLVELLISTALLTVIMGATLGGLSNASKANEAVIHLTGMNSSVRAGMDLMVRDFLQVGSGLPPGHVILVPSGTGAQAIRIPGPPGTAFTLPVGDTDIGAIVPSPGLGHSVNGNNTDVVTILMADNTFLNVPLTATTATSVDVAAGPDLANGPDRVTAGQLMMVSKGSVTTLLQVTDVNLTSRRLIFADNDSLNLNQSGAAAGNLVAVNAADPPNTPSASNITRIRMVTYYLDATTVPGHPRLVRRINNGDPLNYNNNAGNAVAIDVENLQFSYDLVDGNTNPANVRMTMADRNGTGRCSPNPCMEAQIRKGNIAVTGRSRNGNNRKLLAFRNTLATQVSFRGMAFVDEYRAP